jgi:predicted Zn-ribbon and HTH transcriptional regulator
MTHQCLRCQHTWNSTVEFPSRCPKPKGCGSHTYDTPRGSTNGRFSAACAKCGDEWAASETRLHYPDLCPRCRGYEHVLGWRAAQVAGG